jgi:predicted Rossmann-fold nucleotide-binding protein
VGVEFFTPLLEFVKNRLLRDGMIDAQDIDMLILTDDLEYITNEIESSLLDQITLLKEVGLSNTKYYKSLFEFSLNKNK